MLGFNELVGVKLEKADYVSRVLTDMFRQNGYQQISVPIVELASSFSEEVVGESPWPEWNKKGCFYFDVQDYDQSFDANPTIHKVLLVPEGTISITRWLGESLDNKSVVLPIRVFYYLKCFRNELISTLSKTKGREFTQFGMEIMGDDDIMAEVETIHLIIGALEQFGVKREAIHVRFNDISIFNQLIIESGLQDRRIVIKESLDSLAEVKAGKKPERYEDIVKELNEELQNVVSDVREKWNAIIFQDDYTVSKALTIFGDEYVDKFMTLIKIQEAFATCGVNVDLDLCVIRSHEYYTSMSFEVDVVGNKEKFVEIAGGGRYDRLVSNFIHTNQAPCVVPCVGFAFGTERVIELLDQEGLYQKGTILTSRFDFVNGTSNVLGNEKISIIRQKL